MRAGKRLALDANILLRGVFGVRVRELSDRYADEIRFCSPDICFDDARRYIPLLAARRGFAASAGLEVLDGIARFVELVDRDLYEEYEGLARASIASRDIADWPVLATALLLQCPVWTEDRDFFGSGVATWTTATVEVYLRDV